MLNVLAILLCGMCGRSRGAEDGFPKWSMALVFGLVLGLLALLHGHAVWKAACIAATMGGLWFWLGNAPGLVFTALNGIRSHRRDWITKIIGPVNTRKDGVLYLTIRAVWFAPAGLVMCTLLPHAWLLLVLSTSMGVVLFLHGLLPQNDDLLPPDEMRHKVDWRHHLFEITFPAMHAALVIILL